MAGNVKVGPHAPGRQNGAATLFPCQTGYAEAFMAQRWKAILASIVTMGLVTVTGVIFIFRPLAEADTASAAWPAPVAILVYLVLSVLLLDWAARRTRSTYSAAFIIGSAQFIVIVDLLSRGERGVLTAAAGTALLIVSWGCVAFVHSRLTGTGRT